MQVYMNTVKNISVVDLQVTTKIPEWKNERQAKEMRTMANYLTAVRNVFVATSHHMKT